MLDEPVTPVADSPVETVTKSPAAQKFQLCRWRKAGENGTADCCSHRDVLPYAGANGFDPEAWCPDCKFFKVRRTPRKRPIDEYGY